MFKILRKSASFLVLISFLFFLCILGEEYYIIATTKHDIYTEVSDIPYHSVWVVLGTSKYIPDGRRNLFYLYRIEAAKSLYESGKIDYILVSGDNSTSHYNETDTMRNDLIAAGIPAEKIYGDYAGFRTLDSVVRAKDIFGQSEYTIISQKFHLERAIFIAEHHGIQAVGFNATEVPVKLAPRVWIRERLARVKMVFDIVFGVEPKFGGERIKIG